MRKRKTTFRVTIGGISYNFKSIQAILEYFDKKEIQKAIKITVLYGAITVGKVDKQTLLEILDGKVFEI